MLVDRFKSPAIVCLAFNVCAVATVRRHVGLCVAIDSMQLFVYRSHGADSFAGSVVLLLVNGMMINGPYALITTAISADLVLQQIAHKFQLTFFAQGSHESLKGNSRALATVCGILDGTGSIGAAVGPFLAGAIPDWNNLFYFLMASVAASGAVRARGTAAPLSRPVPAARLCARGPGASTEAAVGVVWDGARRHIERAAGPGRARDGRVGRLESFRCWRIFRGACNHVPPWRLTSSSTRILTAFVFGMA